MSDSSSTTTVYDPFEGSELDTGKWMSLPLPLPDGTVRLAVEATASTVVQRGILSITVAELQNAHDTVQTADNAKHMLVSTEQFALPQTGTATFAIDQAVTRLGASVPEDPMLAVAAFNVLDAEHGLVYDILSSGGQVLAVHEQLAHAPNPSGPPYTHVVTAPFAPIDVAPGVPNRCAIEFDIDAACVRWLVDDVEIYRVAGGPWPERLGFGLALMSGVRLRDGRSTSVRGQGLRASWSPPSVTFGDK